MAAVNVPLTGTEWIVDADGCIPSALADLDSVRRCCDEIIAAMNLHVAAPPLWRRFDGPGGVTGLYLLSESHLTCHTFPEHGLLTLNVYCCKARIAPDWESLLKAHFGSTNLHVRELTRGGLPKFTSLQLREAAT
jgi:S-adenosylmethionine decarboxylase